VATYFKSAEPSGAEYIDYCMTSLGISQSMLASLLSVTERELSRWSDMAIISKSSQRTFERLNILRTIIHLADGSGIKGKMIINLLNEPIPGDDDQKTLMHYVIDQPDRELIKSVTEKVIAVYQ
jgi:hypothetical protein